MSDEETLQVVRSLVEAGGQERAGEVLGVARSLLSMVLSGKAPVSAKLREKVAQHIRDGGVEARKTESWDVPAFEQPPFVEVDIRFRFPWLSEVECKTLAETLASYCRQYIVAYADSKLPTDSAWRLDVDRFPDPVFLGQPSAGAIKIVEPESKSG
jgi:hypothetical protein